MATKRWIGRAAAVKQVDTVQITAYDAATTYTVTIGGVTVSVAGDTDADTTASNLKIALEASTHPYFVAVDWTVSTDTVTGTAGTAGVPFVLSTSVAGGAGTIADVQVTVSAGPNDWSTAENWNSGTIPVNGDDVIINNFSDGIVWGLDQNGVDLGDLRIEASFTGVLGLDVGRFAQSADGMTTVDLDTAEYREDYLRIQFTTCDVGIHAGPGVPGSSGRIKIDNTSASASTCVVHNTAVTTRDTGLPAFRYLAAHANADLFIRSARAGVGVAIDVPGETSTVGDIKIVDTASTTSLFLGEGVTVTSIAQLGGVSLIQAAATITTITVDGGILTTEGDYTVTTLTARGGTVYPNHIKTAGNAITTLDIDGGTVNGARSSAARTWATVTLTEGTMEIDASDVTITTLTRPSKRTTITIA